MGRDELLHQLVTLRAVDDLQLDAAGAGVIFRAAEREVLSVHDVLPLIFAGTL